MADLERDPLSGLIGTIDTKYEEDGAWFEHAPEEGEAGPNQIDGYRHKLLDANGNGLRRVQVVSRHLKEFQKEDDDLDRRLLRLPEKKRASKKRENNNRLAGKHALRGWDLTNRQGEAVPFDRALAVRLMTEPQYRNHRAFVYEAIVRVEGEINDAAEEDEKN